MSTKLVQDEITRFLSTSDPEVLCIKGKWGIGKTFLWQKLLSATVKDKTLKLSRYAYASLFGVNSLDGLKLSICENTELLFDIPPSDGIPTSVQQVAAKAQGLAKKTVGAVAQVAGYQGIADVINQYAFQAVRNQIVCIDDLERRSADLSVKDILGLISFLKEQRKCKIVILLNDEELGEDGTKEFEQYFEKVVDVSLEFAPTPEDATKIALPETDRTRELVAEKCVALNISNIRVIGKINRLVRIVEKMASGYNEQVMSGVIHSLVLFGWSKFQPETSVPIEFLMTRKTDDSLARALRQKEPPEDEKRWEAQLDNYHFSGLDEFDECLLTGVARGYFDPNEIKQHATAMHSAAEKEMQRDALRAAWRLLEDSFSNNENEVAEAIFSSSIALVAEISLLLANRTIVLLRTARRDDLAKQLIETYVRSPQTKKDISQDSEHLGDGEQVDADFAKALHASARETSRPLDPVEALMRIGRRTGFDTEDIESAARLTEDELYDILKAHSGLDLRRILRGAVKFLRSQAPSDQMMALNTKATKVLERLGNESPINKIRIARHLSS